MPAPLVELESGAVQYRSAEVRDVDAKEGVLWLRAAPYEVEGDVGPFSEVFSKGTFARAAKDPSRLALWSGHGGAVVGRAYEAEDLDDGFYFRSRVSQTTAGRDLLIQIEDGTLRDASVEFQPLRDFMAITERSGRMHVRHRRAHLLGAAIVFEGAYPGAEVLAVRDAERDRAKEEARMWFEGFKQRRP